MLLDNPRLNDLTRDILGAGIEVHRVLGPGLLESTYQACLQFELAHRGLRFSIQRPIPIMYKHSRLEASYRVDLIVEDLVIVEIKCVDVISPIHKAQVLTYLRLSAIPVGLLINFHVAKLMDGVRRLINPAVEF
jgi:GxxExxY protein